VHPARQFINAPHYLFGLPCRFKADKTALNKKKIAEMDLDDILNKAEEHETVRRQTLAQHHLVAKVSYINWLS